MQDHEEYYTDCLFKASSIVQKTGKFPDEYIKIEHEKNITMKFNSVHKELLRDLKAGLLKVEPLSFKQIFIQIRRIVFDVLDNGEVQNDNKEIRD